MSIAADGFFTINPQVADLDLLPARSRVVVHVSDALRRASRHAPVLVQVADSVVRGNPGRAEAGEAAVLNRAADVLSPRSGLRSPAR